MNLMTLVPLALKVSIILIVLSIGLKVASASIIALSRRPFQFIKFVLPINLVMVLTALMLAVAFDLHPAIKIALVSLAVSPVPPILPNKAFKAGGAEEFTIGLFVTASVFSIVFIPFAIWLCGLIFSIPMSISVVAITKVVFITTLLPLLVGVLIAHFAPTPAEKLSKVLGIVGTVVLALSALAILVAAGPAILSLIGNGSLLALAAFVIVGLGVGHLMGGRDPQTQPVLALTAASRHPAMAVLIGQQNFPDQRLVLPAVLLYLIVGAVLSGIYLKTRKNIRPM